ncbi:MAG: DNA alkylation repair protein [Pseudomonadota bacterium]
MAKKLKDWFDGECATLLGRAIKANYKTFDIERYAAEVNQGVGPLKLKDRVGVMSDALRARLPQDFEEAGAITTASLGPRLEGETGMFTSGYWLMPVARLVEDHGIHDLETSLDLCEEITQRHTAEYAIRPHLEAYPSETLTRLNQWTRHSSSHVRRLASEAVRPRLPWARRLSGLTEDPGSAIAIACALRSDPSPYVRKSVANLLNDLSKDHPALVIELVGRWQDTASRATNWVIRHGTRTLRKQGLLV